METRLLGGGKDMSDAGRLTVAVCDDEPELLAGTCRLLGEVLADTDHRICPFADPRTLLKQPEPFDIAVLDIQLPRQSGIELARQLLRRSPGCQIIFLTAYMAYCQDVYDVEHIAFVLKEEMATRLPPAVQRACRRLEHRDAAAVSGQMLILGVPGHAIQIPAADILYLERQVRVTWVHTLGGSFSTPDKLEELVTRLDPVCFCQTHKSFAIHWTFAGKYEKNTIRMRNGVDIPVSRSYAAAVRRSFLAYAARQSAPEVNAP